MAEETFEPFEVHVTYDEDDGDDVNRPDIIWDYDLEKYLLEAISEKKVNGMTDIELGQAIETTLEKHGVVWDDGPEALTWKEVLYELVGLMRRARPVIN